MARPISPLHLAGSGNFLGPYLLKECIGRGGTAAIYRATRTGAAGFEKQVVVKTLLPELAHDARFVELFTEEAKLQAQLFHANIVQVHDFGVLRGTPFLELELLHGWNLRDVFGSMGTHNKRMPVPIALAILSDACRGLAYAHAFVDGTGALRPIIHRDISPANVMICSDGAVKLLDFGLASITRGETLEIDTFRGKLAYMSPEQLERGRVDRTADVFAFGVLMHELLTGERLFAGNDDRETVRRVQSLVVEPPSSRNRAVPRALDKIILRALERDPDERYASAGALLAAIEGLRLKIASRSEVLAFLGTLAPAIFTTPCEACGRAIPQGSECTDCRTVVGAIAEDAPANPTASAAPPRLFLVKTPARGTLALRLDEQSRARLLSMLRASVMRWRDKAAQMGQRLREGTAWRLERVRDRSKDLGQDLVWWASRRWQAIRSWRR